MVMNNTQPTAEQRQAWLVEYQVCQQQNGSSASSYWLIVSIFMGINVGALGWIASSMASRASFTLDGNLFVLGQVIDENAKLLILAFGVAMLSIVVVLKLWLKRVNYMAERNYERMHEIELELGMWQSWRIHILDSWNGIRRRKSFRKIVNLSDEHWVKLRNEVQKGLSGKYCSMLETKKDDIIGLCNRYPKQRWYEGPSRNLHYGLLFAILSSLWLLVILHVFFPWIFSFLALIPVTISIVLIRFPHLKDNEWLKRSGLV